MDNKDYEDHVRSNESIRDSMDGRLSEPRMSQSSEQCQQNEKNYNSEQGEN